MQTFHVNRQRLSDFATSDNIRLMDAEAAHVLHCEECRQLLKAFNRQRLKQDRSKAAQADSIKSSAKPDRHSKRKSGAA
jgi:hypothetical protein